MASGIGAVWAYGYRSVQIRSLGAVSFVLGAQALLALTDSFAPFVAAEMSVWQFHVIRAGMMLPVILAAILVMGTWHRLRPSAPGAVGVRTFLNVAALGSYFAVLPQIPLAQAAAGLFTAPIWVVVFLAVRDRAWPNRHSFSAAMLGFAGVVLALGGDGSFATDPAAFVPLASGALYALSVLSTNRKCAHEAPCSLLFWNVLGFCLLGILGMLAVEAIAPGAETVAALPHLLAGPQWVAPSMLVLIAILGCMSILAVGLLTRGYQTGDANYVALFDYSYLVWAAAFSALIWDNVPELQSLAGLVLILVAGACALTKSGSSQAQEKPS